MTFRYFIPPILYLTTAFMAGIILQSTEFVMYLPLLMIASIIIFFSYIAALKKQFLLIMLLSCIGGSLSIYKQKYDFIIKSQELPRKACALRALVTDVLYTTEKNFSYRYDLTVTHIKMQGTWKPYTCKLHLFLRFTSPELYPGMIIETKPLTICPITKKDLQEYAIKLGVIGSIFCSTIDYMLIQDTSNSWWYAKHRIIQYFKQHLSPPCFYLLSAIFLGNKSNNDQDQRTLFNRWGIAHHLARSGLHLMIIIIVWSACFVLLPLHFYKKQLVLVFFTLIYFHMSWASIPFYRALFVFFINKLCLLVGIHCHTLHCLALVCLLCLAYNPIQLFFLDFQLSFALTFALIIINQFEIIQKNNKHQILAQE